MATCMECIHFNPCNMNGKIIVEKPTEGNDWGLHNEVEKECKYFTLTADVAEVVRCKDCKSAVVTHSFLPEKLCLVHRVSVPEGYFCASGERRDT